MTSHGAPHDSRMTIDHPNPTIAVRAPWLYRLITRGATAIAFGQGVVTIEGVPGQGHVTLSLEEIDQFIKDRSWFGTRLTIRVLSGLEYSIAGLPKQPAALLAASLQNEAAQLARQIGEQSLQREAQIRNAFAGERYLRYGDGEELRRQIEQTTTEVRSRIVRAHLGGEALGALDSLQALEAAADFERARADANRRFVSAAIPAVSDAMEASFAFKPTDEQAKAIATDEETTLVLAGAGTGKTGIITGKVAHLVRNCGVLPEQILVLAYNRKAADEIRTRIGDDLSGCDVRTFHAFGHAVVRQDSSAPSISRMATDQRFRSRQFDRILDELFSNAAEAPELANFVAYHSQPYHSPFDFDNFSDYRSYTRGIELRTLTGDQVKSYEELEVANFLALNGITAEYEAPYQVGTADPRYRQYRPDFYLPDADIYIEHFALDANGKPPSSWQRYHEGVLWKRSLHRQCGTRLIETYSWQHQDGSLLPELDRRLREYGVRFERTPVEQLLANLRNIIASWLGQLLATFLSLVKTAGFTMSELRERAVALPLSNAVRSNAFLDLFERVWNRYEDLLDEENAVDFDDLINRATDIIETGRWVSPFRYVLVDEFQDISAGRLALLKALKTSGIAYFLVGDDWQSINRFAGSDVGLMTSCGDHLGFVAQRELSQTFRYGESIIGPSSTFIQRNPEQTQRTLKGQETGADDGVTLITATEQVDGAARALADIAERVPPQQEASVLMLGRYRRSVNGVKFRSPRPEIRVKPSTIHSAKGQEADYAVVLDLADGFSGFPAAKENDPLLNIVMSESSPFPHAEERRLFYVAMTRARRQVYLVADAARPSAFVRELRRGQPDIRQLGRFADDDAPPCPRCGGRLIVSQTGKTRRCTNHPLCEYQTPRCGVCESGYVIVGDGRTKCSNSSCAGGVRACPRCKIGILGRRQGQFGEFWGCSEYYAEPPCRYTCDA